MLGNNRGKVIIERKGETTTLQTKGRWKHSEIVAALGCATRQVCQKIADQRDIPVEFVYELVCNIIKTGDACKCPEVEIEVDVEEA